MARAGQSGNVVYTESLALSPVFLFFPLSELSRLLHFICVCLVFELFILFFAYSAVRFLSLRRSFSFNLSFFCVNL